MTNCDFRLAGLSLPARILLTCFVALIGFGYLSAIGNLYHQHQYADGLPGLTLDDLRVSFHGMSPVDAGGDGAAAASAGNALRGGNAPGDGNASGDSDDSGDGGASSRRPGAAGERTSSGEGAAALGDKSRMLEKVEPGGSMRKHLLDGGEPAVRALTGWLQKGARREEFEKGDLPQADDPSPKSIIEDRCLSCHNAQTGERSDLPYGPDLFTVEYELVLSVARPGTATGEPGPARPGRKALSRSPAAGESADSSASGRIENGSARAPAKRNGPMPLPRLFLVTHIHMLSIPLFTLIVGGLFLLADWPRAGVRGVLAVVPIVTLIFDFSSWWLARLYEPFIYVIAAAGGIYGAAFGFQILTVFAALWFGRRPSGPGAAPRADA